MNTENKFDSQFRKRARELKIKPSNRVWAGIDAELSNNKRTSIYSIIGIAASILLLVGFVGIYSIRTNSAMASEYHVVPLEQVADQSYNKALMTWITYNGNIKSDGF